MKFFFISLFFLLSLFSPVHSEKWGIVSVPVADLRASSGSVATSYDYDPLQETQLLYGEVVKIVSESGDWLKVEAVEQQEFSHNNRWEGYPGWVKKNAVSTTRKKPKQKFVIKKKTTFLYSLPLPLTEVIVSTISLGTKVAVGKISATVKGNVGPPINQDYSAAFQDVKTPEGKRAWILEEDMRPLKKKQSKEELRQLIVDSASELLGDPYFWGGRSAHIPAINNQVTGVDCSGLVNLAYRVAGIEIPRDSLEQYMKAKKINASQIKMGDLIFSAPKDKPEKISHVAIFIDTATLIEAPQTGLTVRKISFQEKFGVPFSELENGKVAGDRILYFGTYFNK